MITVAVGCIRKAGSILLCRRPASATYPLKWEFPGGKVERGETPAECLKRELREELAIEAVIGGILHRQQIVYPDAGSFDVLYFDVESYTGEPRNLAFSEVRWVPLDELKRIDVLEGNREMIRVLLNGQHG